MSLPGAMPARPATTNMLASEYGLSFASHSTDRLVWWKIDIQAENIS